MLNDLEKRDAFLHEKHDSVLDGLYSAYDIELAHKSSSHSSSRTFIYILTAISITVGLIYFYLNSNTPFQTPSVEVDSFKDEIKHISSNAVPKVKSRVSNDSAQSKGSEHLLKLDDSLLMQKPYSVVGSNESGSLNIIKEIFFDTNDQGINLVIKMPDEIDYLVYGLSDPGRVVVEINDAKLDFLLEELKPVAPVVAIRYSMNKENRFKLVLETDQALMIRKTTSSVDKNINNLIVAMDYHFQEGLVEKNSNNSLDDILNDFVDEQVVNETVYKGELVKTPVNQNVNAYAEKLFQQGYKDYKKGDISNSLKRLNMALDQDAAHVNARSTLATILSKQGHIELAYSILNEGLIQYPDQVAWLKIYARLLLSESKLVEAKNMLEQYSPDLADDGEYYALKAAILQKLNEHQQSAKIYRDLLQFNPSKSIWWMGLGISLESLKRYQDALYAYQKASTNSSLASDTRKFIHQKIASLSSLIKDESS
tara:strand:- start:27844 stop:29289 length:1446 start_codon:yes stop_codon:yes gene_type:complete